MRISSGFSCNYVIWISSLSDDEIGPSNRMLESIKNYSEQYSFGFRHKAVNTASELRLILENIAIESKNLAFKPLIHFDTHGDNTKGLFISGENTFIPWAELASLLQKINIGTNNNLAVVGATCYGFKAISSISILEPVPFFLLIAPQHQVEVGFLEDFIPQFYKILFEKLSINDAYFQLKKEFEYFHCEKAFFLAIKGYIEGHCQGQGLKIRKEMILTEVLNQSGIINNSFNRRAIRKNFKEFYKPDQRLVDKFALSFLMGKPHGFTIGDVLISIKKDQV